MNLVDVLAEAALLWVVLMAFALATYRALLAGWDAMKGPN